MPPLHTMLAERIADLGIGQNELARRVGIGAGLLNRVLKSPDEKAAQPLPDHHIEPLADALGWTAGTAERRAFELAALQRRLNGHPVLARVIMDELDTLHSRITKTEDRAHLAVRLLLDLLREADQKGCRLQPELIERIKALAEKA